MKASITVTLVDGVRITIPDSLDLNTTYVLREQNDWFEDEIKFLRQLLQAGEKTIDIGANYGVYTLPMAKLVGGSGQVWAFEPASMTADFLAKSIADNGFEQIVLEQSAVSNVKGVAQLSLNDDSELNALLHDQTYCEETETVTLTTLDECLEIHDWEDISFLKIDAEGEEGNILRGGTKFFSVESPLVQYEVKAGTEMHLDLVEEFSALGYTSYRLIPGLGVLVPFDVNERVDGYLLNLFSCKNDCAIKLAGRGLMVDVEALRSLREKGSNKKLVERNSDNSSSWLSVLLKMPYGETCADLWKKTIAAGMSCEVEKSLSLYGLSRDSSLSSTERFVALEESYLCLKAACETQSNFLRESSLARIAREYGARSHAVKILEGLCNKIFQQRKVDFSEPFLAPGVYFDSVRPQNAIGNWLATAALEELERNAVFSSYFSGESALSRLELIHKLGFGSDEMERRLSLVRQRYGFRNA